MTSRLYKQPIIIFRMVGECTSRDVESIFRERLVFLEENNYPMVYSITDTSQLRASDEALFEFFHAAGDKRPGTARDDRVIPILTGSGSRAMELYQTLTAKPGYRGMRIPVFLDVDQAVRFVRDQLFRGGPSAV